MRNSVDAAMRHERKQSFNDFIVLKQSMEREKFLLSFYRTYPAIVIVSP